jgi:hypothetical protein
MAKREKLFGIKNYTPSDPIDHFTEGTYFLTKIDEVYRRFYS